MFRMIGFVVGSVVSIIGILLVLGVPEFHLSSIETDQARFDAALDKIREKSPAIEQAADDLVSTVSDVIGQTGEPTSTDETDAVPDAANVEEPETVAGTFEPDPEDTEHLLARIMDIDQQQQQWHEFWNPFRSEIAARGFVTQLEKVTGLDYRIVKVKAGAYQVGFAYQSDDERRSKVSQISAATGLDLPQP